MSKSKTVLLLGTAAALSGCGEGIDTTIESNAASENQEIWNGVADTNADQRYRDRVAFLSIVSNPPAGSPAGTPNGSGSCTGTFITQDILLTASHCILAMNLPGNTRGTPISAEVSVGQQAGAPSFKRFGTAFVGRTGGDGILDTLDNLNSDIALIFLETAEQTLARFPNGLDGTAGNTDDPLGPDGVLGTADDVDAFIVLPTKPFAGTALAASGTLTGFIEEVGYGRITGGVVSGGARNRNTFGTFPYFRTTSAPSAGNDLDRNGTPDQFLAQRFAAIWNSTPGVDGIPGNADDVLPVFQGTDNGDSGGPILLWNATTSAYEQIGVASTSCTPSDTRDADNVPGNGNESLTCSPVQCAAGNYWNGAICTAIPAAPPVPPGSPPGTPAPPPITTQTSRYVSTWADITTRTFTGATCTASTVCPAEMTCVTGRCTYEGNQEWIARSANASGRPNRWSGERDYAGLCRNGEADRNCDRQFDDQGTCPNFFDAEAGFIPEIRTNPPVIFGSTGIDLHDRVVVKASPDPRNMTAGGVAARKGTIMVRNDVRVGRIWGGDYFEAQWRSSWTSAFLNFPSTYRFVGTYPTSMNPTGGAILPTLRYTARPATLAAGTGFPSLNVSVTPPTALPTTMGPLQNCTSTTPDTVISPGSYISALTINGTCRVSLTAGKYYFDSLTVEPDAQIKINHSGGAVEIFVRNALNFKGRLSNTSGRSTAHVLSYFGTATAYVNGPYGFVGTLVAPNATIDLGSYTHMGAFYGNKVVVHQGAQVLFSPCAGSLDGTAGN
jgi:hypothetical protein